MKKGKGIIKKVKGLNETTKDKHIGIPKPKGNTLSRTKINEIKKRINKYGKKHQY